MRAQVGSGVNESFSGHPEAPDDSDDVDGSGDVGDWGGVGDSEDSPHAVRQQAMIAVRERAVRSMCGSFA
jgi:hypothetical protein